jgi:hypothetical protein
MVAVAVQVVAPPLIRVVVGGTVPQLLPGNRSMVALHCGVPPAVQPQPAGQLRVSEMLVKYELLSG